MTVIANWTIAYKDVKYEGGERFEMDESDFHHYRKDVKVVENKKPSLKTKVSKVVKNKRTK